MPLLNSILFGVVFGFLLQRAHILRYDRQVGMLLLRDMTVLKFMLTAAFTGMVGLQLLKEFELVSLAPRPEFLLAFGLGGVIFGLGWGICGYCPGTQLGAAAEGRTDALWSILGGICGSTVVYLLYRLVQLYINPVGFPSFDLPAALGLTPWLLILFIGSIFAAICWWCERRGV